MKNKIKSVTLSFEDINPNVSYMNLISCSVNGKYGPRKIYDYHFMYVCCGKGIIVIDGVEYSANEGDLFFNTPNVEHNIIADKVDPFLLCGMHFTFNAGYKTLPYPIGDFTGDGFDINKVTEIVNFADFGMFEPKFDCKNHPEIAATMLEMVKRYETQQKFYNGYVSAMAKMWLTNLAQLTMMEGGKDLRTTRKMEDIITFIHQNYNKELNYEILGEEFHFHPNHINRLIKNYSGYSLHQYVMNIRIKKALNLLVYSKTNINEISNEIGYSDISYFNRIFKKKTGYTPNQVRKNTYALL